MRRIFVRLAAFGLVLAAAWEGLRLYDRPPVSPGAWLQAAGLEASYETVDGHRLRYVRAGRGDAVMLVHGFASSLYTWKDVIPGLARRHDVIALDLPGFGGSDQPEDLAFEDLPRAVVGLMERLGVRRAALVGNSMGGAAVALVAARSPTRVSALVLVDAAGFDLEVSKRPPVVRLAMSPAAGLLALVPGKRLIVEASLRQVLHDDTLVTPERVSEYLAAFLRTSTFVSIRSLSGSLERGSGMVAEALPRIAAPTLVLWGRQDRWIPLAHADRFVAKILGARKVVLDACGHVPQEERPDEVRRLLEEFLQAPLPAAPPRGDPRANADRG